MMPSFAAGLLSCRDCRKAGCRSAIFLLSLLCSISLGGPAFGQDGEPIFTLTDEDLQERANGALGVLGLLVVPNETATTLSYDTGNGETAFWQSQLGGAFTVSDELPLYLEGFMGAARYDPRFVLSERGEEVTVSPNWTSISGTVGIGWDFPIVNELVFRPILNFSLGHIESDLSVIGRIIDAETGKEIEFLSRGRLNAYGYGGSLMLDWEHYRKEYEIDVELRYTHIHLESFGGTSSAVKGEANAATLGLWSRLRVPTGKEVFGSPLRAVGELSASAFLGDQAEFMDSAFLVQVGAGIEFDFADVSWMPASRTRLIGRYLFGRDLSGFALGIGISF